MININQNTAVKILMPTLLAYGAYKSATYKESTTKQTPSEAKIFQSLQPFLEKTGIRKDLKIKETGNYGFAEALGTNYFTSSDTIIHTAPKFHEVDPHASSFVLKHEISHLKHNDHVAGCLFALIPTLAAIFLTSSTDESLAADITAFAGASSLFAYKFYREMKADDFAIENSSIDELKGGRRFFKAMQQIYLESRETSRWKKFFISSNGENNLDVLHPSLANRIQKIETSLQAKNAIINEKSEQEKIEKLKTYIKNIGKEMREKIWRV